jgi:hypothetical protein
MHPEIGGSGLLNRLMVLNRSRVFARLEEILADRVSVLPCRRFVERLLAGEGPGG